MARELTFLANGTEYAVSPVKIDRKKLYGWTENLAQDDDGRECKLVNMDRTGTLIIPSGGMGLGALSDEGLWVKNSELMAVYDNGMPAEIIPSSYSSQIDLSKKATLEDFLNYSTIGFYELCGADEGLVRFVGDDMYTFSYCYRDAYEGKTAFLLTADDADKNKRLFMLIGALNVFEMLGINQQAVADDDPEDDAEEDDEIDFSMF
ncbi:MAG: hypothetical protein LBD45_04375 [Bacteroidales bacterium]|jgi:hypothetical protein|nr:hypothetical protein [Bacteroidales bacterium]